MCGLVGIFGNELTQKDTIELKKMLNEISHRGPDAVGIYCDNDKKCFLGHKRLSIIDLSEKANQPMTDLDEDIVIVFNGEIYNYLEIRKELIKEFVFKTDHSDTETIIYAYKKWGIKFLNRVNGMFAIAVYDKRINKLFLIRDRFGKKPLYYTNLEDKIYFSSEIRSFFVLNNFRREINHQAIYDYLTYLTIYPPNTFYKNVSKVNASHYVEVNLDKDAIDLKSINYWDIADSLNIVRNIEYSEAFLLTNELFKNSINLRNISDVPLAISLSGGIDSSLNLILSHRINPNLFAINISYLDTTAALDESLAAERLAKDNNVNFIPIKINGNIFIENFEEFSDKLLDMPIVWPDMLLMYIISKKLKELGIKVVLIGEGGDELGAYPIYFDLIRSFKKFNRFKRILYSFAKKASFISQMLDKKTDLFHKGILISNRHVHSFNEYEKKIFWQGPRVNNSYDILGKIMTEISVEGSEGFIRKILNLEYKLRLPELLLPRIDYSTMYNSIEARSPFLDHKLVEESLKIPFLIRNKDGPKSLIKEIAAEYLPDYIMQRPKSGFGQEFSIFFSQDFNTWFNNEILLIDAPIKIYIKPGFLKKIYLENLKKRNRGYQMWVIYTLNKWLVNNLL